MTHRLYYTDCHLCEFEAAIVDRTDGGRRVYLDQTAFYPSSGGQPHDTGMLGGSEVADVVDEGGRIAHLLTQPVAGDRLTGLVNWSRRFDHMQQHTGQHLLSAVLADLWRHTTVSVHIGQESSTIDLEACQLTPEQIRETETRANELVTENRPVEISFEDAASAIGLRKVSTRLGTIRIVTIQELDRSACGGTHVRATGEIGAILVRKVERVRKGVRLEFLCGQRAIRRTQGEAEVLAHLATEFSSSVQELPQLISLQRAELREETVARRELETRLDLCRARELYAAATPDATGTRRALVRESGASLNDLRGLAQAFASLPRAVFIGAVEDPPSVLLTASADSGIDAGSVLQGLLRAAGGRGGGSAGLAQGVLPRQALLDRVILSLGGAQG